VRTRKNTPGGEKGFEIKRGKGNSKKGEKVLPTREAANNAWFLQGNNRRQIGGKKSENAN